MSDLTGKISAYNARVPALVRELTRHPTGCHRIHKIETEGSQRAALSHAFRKLEPVLLTVRPGNNSSGLGLLIEQSLVEEHGCLLLDVPSIISDESLRGTEVGRKIGGYLKRGKKVPMRFIAATLRKVIYSGGVGERYLLRGLSE